MKKLIALILAVLFVTALAGCGSGTKAENPAETPTTEVALDVNAVAESINASVEMKDGMKLIETEKNAENAFPGLTALSDNYAIYINATGGYAEEIAVITLKEGGNMADLEKLANERVEYQKITFEDYQPREMAKLADPVIVTEGNTLIMVVSDDSATAREAVKTAVAK